MEFGSEEYLQELIQRCSTDEIFLELSKGENGSWTFIMEAEADKGVNEDMVFGYIYEDGVMTDIWRGKRKTDYTVTGKYGVWVDILIGKTRFLDAFRFEKLRFIGKIFLMPFSYEVKKVLEQTSTIERFIEISRTIPTEFHGEYTKYNF